MFGKMFPAWPVKTSDYLTLRRILESLHLHKQAIDCGNDAASSAHGSDIAMEEMDKEESPRGHSQR